MSSIPVPFSLPHSDPGADPEGDVITQSGSIEAGFLTTIQDSSPPDYETWNFSEVTTAGLRPYGSHTSGSQALDPEDIAEAVLLWIIFVMALVGNISVLVFGASKHAQAQAVPKLFVCSLAVADLSLTLGVTWVQAMETISTTGWLFSRYWCNVYNFLRSMTSHASIGTLTAISIDRYFAVTRPEKLTITVRRAMMMIAYVWLHCSLTNLPWLVRSQLIAAGPSRWRCSIPTPEGLLGSAGVSMAYAMFLRLANFFIPIVITWMAYIAILTKMWTSRKKVAAHMSSGSSANTMTRKVSLMCLLVLMAFTVLWTPFQIVVADLSLRGDGFGRRLAGPLFVVALANSCVNPIIYGVMWRPFRQAIRRVFGDCCPYEDGAAIYEPSHNTNRKTARNTAALAERAQQMTSRIQPHASANTKMTTAVDSAAHSGQETHDSLTPASINVKPIGGII